jgi:multidrug efflux pump subunit AcrA (membrane-fusion protein)
VARRFPRRRLIPILFLGLLLLAAGIWYANQPGSLFQAASTELRASGTIEAEEASVTAEAGGRVVEILVKEGDAVSANAVLARLDSESALTELARAQAALSEAQARLDLAKNGARPEDKTQADAALAQAVAAREGAQRAWEDAQAILAKPQELDAKIASAQAQVVTVQQQIEAAKAQRAQAVAARDRYNGDGSALGKTLFDSFDLQVQAADESILAATAQYDGAQTAVKDLTAIRANPLDLKTQVHQAEARLREAEAGVALAQAVRDLVYAGATKEDLAMAQAAVRQAQAAVSGAQARLDKLSLRAPIAGRISLRSINIGQVISPGISAFTVVNADRVTLTVYLPEDRIGHVRVDQTARVTVDSFPGRAFQGRVIFISPKAEFTPKNVQTAEGRVSQVFAVKIRLDNPDHALKPGMPADAVLGGQAAGGAGR